MTFPKVTLICGTCGTSQTIHVPLGTAKTKYPGIGRQPLLTWARNEHGWGFDAIGADQCTNCRETDPTEVEWVTTRQAAEIQGVSYMAFKMLTIRYPDLYAAKKPGTVRGQTAYWRRSVVEEWEPPGRGYRTDLHRNRDTK